MDKYDELKKLFDEALGDLAKDCDCKFCSNLSQCSTRRVERNLAYGNCSNWEWRGAKMAEKAS